MANDNELTSSLRPTRYIDSASPEIVSLSGSIIKGAEGDIEKAVKLFYWVRDNISYNPYRFNFDPKTYVATFVLKQGDGFCIQKSILLAALSRAAGIPCRLRFATVRNHLTTRRLKELMKTDLFVFHGYNEFFLSGAWVKATPTFNISLCDKFGVKALEFDGRTDSVLHPYDRSGNRHMEYLHDYGSFDDFPFEMMTDEWRRNYPHLLPFIDRFKGESLPAADFEREAGEEGAGSVSPD
jgi:transglutaminase-like putative cysteine protease